MKGLKEFILRTEALHLYRKYLRVTRLAQPEARAELHAQVRAEFEASRSARHAYAAKYALSEGRVRLRQLEEMLGMQG